VIITASCQKLKNPFLDRPDYQPNRAPKRPNATVNKFRFLTPSELPTLRFQAELGTGRVAEVIDLSVNGVRGTLMPHCLGDLSGSAVDAARRAGDNTHPP
ncbi:MAG: hypothetical protein ABSH35_26555, partial [Isosphaeraceae bacterium]